MDAAVPHVSENFEKRKICVLIPTFNNAKTLRKIIEDVLSFTPDIIVVNDGSTDSTSEILADFKKIYVLGYPDNVGKGWALRKGFGYALTLGYDYAITIDSDGQHFAKDLPVFIAKLEEAGPCLIIGSRNMNQSSVPGKSTVGLKISNFWFNVETGIKTPDTQSGYRLFPLQLIKDIDFITKKFEFEIEVIVRAAWKNIKIESVPVTVYYAPASERVSHFRPFTDFTRVGILHFILTAITFLYINPRNFFRKAFRASTYRTLRKQIFNPDDSKGLIATSIGFGIFMGIIPIWGFQMLIAVFLAVIFRLNKGLVILAANISIPPMIPLIVYLSYKAGSYWTGKNSADLHFDKSSLETIRTNFIQYIYGSITLAVIAALISGFSAYLFLSFYKRQHSE